MAKAYRIREWRERYEVSDKNRSAQGRDKLRRGPLEYVRMKVAGHKKGAGQLRLEQIAGSKARYEACMAVFPQLLGLAGDQAGALRGWLLDEHRQPATAESIAFFTGFRALTVAIALEVLSDTRVRWIEQVEFPEIPGKIRELPEIPGDSPPDTDTDTDTDTESETDTEPDSNKEAVVSGKVPFETILAGYNETCPPKGMTKARLTEGRKEKLRVRWKEPAFREGFGEVFVKAAASTFLCGGGEQGWKADFGWLIYNEENYIKVLEGKYDNTERPVKGDTKKPGEPSGPRFGGDTGRPNLPSGDEIVAE